MLTFRAACLCRAWCAFSHSRLPSKTAKRFFNTDLNAALVPTSVCVPGCACGPLNPRRNSQKTRSGFQARFPGPLPNTIISSGPENRTVFRSRFQDRFWCKFVVFPARLTPIPGRLLRLFSRVLVDGTLASRSLKRDCRQYPSREAA